jgi:uncharacterized protein YkwD
MSAPGRADMGRMARLRLPLLAAIAICAAAGAAAPSALGAHARAAHTRTSHGRPHHGRPCAGAGRSPRGRHHTRAASYRNSHRPHRTGRCVRRHGGVTHRAGKHHRRPSLHRLARGHRLDAPRRGSAADTGGVCADADLAPSSWNVERVRAAVLCLINRERAAHGESALERNSRLEQAAQSHTESMAFGGYFEHSGPRGDTPLDRMRASGYIYSSQIGYEIAENIAWGSVSLGTPHAIVAAWMASPGHRANILNSRFRDTAVGVSPHVPSSLGGSQQGGIYTQDFGVIIGG